MSHALSIKADFASFRSGWPFTPRASAVSSAAKDVQDASDTVERHLERSQALFGRKAAVIAEIWATVNECASSDWDGFGATPVSRDAANRAVDFIRSLPDVLPLPEVAPEPDGSISLDWIPSRNTMFSLSAGKNDRLAFAWIDGSDRGHGVARFEIGAIPARVLEGIRATQRHGDVGLGSP